MVSGEESSSGTYILVPTSYGPHIHPECRLLFALTIVFLCRGDFGRNYHIWDFTVQSMSPQMYPQITFKRLFSLREACHYVKHNNPDPEQLFCFVNWPTCQNYSTDIEGNVAKKNIFNSTSTACSRALEPLRQKSVTDGHTDLPMDKLAWTSNLDVKITFEIYILFSGCFEPQWKWMNEVLK